MAVRSSQHTPLWGWLVPQLLDPTHDVLVLAPQRDWEASSAARRPSSHRLGRSAKPLRLMVGRPRLQPRWTLAEARVVPGLPAHRSWRTLCGIDVGRVVAQATPGQPGQCLEASTRTTWRQRLGPEGPHALEAVRPQQVGRDQGRERRRMGTDTTAQPKPVASPTETARLEQGRGTRLTLRGAARATGSKVAKGGRSCRRTATRVVLEARQRGTDPRGRMAAANGQLAAMARHVLRRTPRVVSPLHGQLGALRRQGQSRAAAAPQRLRDQWEQTAALGRRVLPQHAARFAGRHGREKVLRLPAPQVVSMRTGQRSQPTAYGAQVRVAIARNGCVVRQTAYAQPLADPDPLPEALAGGHAVFGRPPPALAGERGVPHPAQERERLGTAQGARVSLPAKGKTRHRDAETAWCKRLPRLRAHLEPVSGPRTTDHRLERCRYTGVAGDQINVSWAVLAWHTTQWGRLLPQRHLAGVQAPRRAA
jgi:IS5 family transposase